jgi:hypothetical protein
MPTNPLPACHPLTTPHHALQLRRPARLASIDRGFRLSAVVYVKIASVSGWIRVESPHDASETRLCFSRRPGAGECLTQAAACPPVGQVRACGRLDVMPAVFARAARHPHGVPTHFSASRLAAPPACPAGQCRVNPADACASECLDHCMQRGSLPGYITRASEQAARCCSSHSAGVAAMPI